MSSLLVVLFMFIAICHSHVIRDSIDGSEEWAGPTPPYAVDPVQHGRWATRQHWSPHLAPGGKRQHWSLSLSPGGKRSYQPEEKDMDTEKNFLNEMRNNDDWKSTKNFTFFLRLLQRYLTDQSRKGDFQW